VPLTGNFTATDFFQANIPGQGQVSRTGGNASNLVKPGDNPAFNIGEWAFNNLALPTTGTAFNSAPFTVLNANGTDIRKSTLHARCIALGLPCVLADADGPPNERVIIKTTLNAGGAPERKLVRQWGAHASQFALQLSNFVLGPKGYVVCRRDAVPAAVWGDPTLVVERFIENPAKCFYKALVVGDAAVVTEAWSDREIKRVTEPIRGRNNYYYWTRDGEHVAVRYADDAMWATRGEQKPIADIYAENGVPLTEAGKGGRVPGWGRLRSYVKDGPACPHHRAPPFGWQTCPMMHIFSTCPEFYRTLSDLPHATTGNPEDAATDGEVRARPGESSTGGAGVAAGATGFGVGGGIGVLSFNSSETVTNLNPFASSSVNVAGIAWMVCAWISWARTIDPGCVSFKMRLLTTFGPGFFQSSGSTSHKIIS